MLKVAVLVTEVLDLVVQMAVVVVAVAIIIREELVIEGMVQINHHQLLSLHKEIMVEQDKLGFMEIKVPAEALVLLVEQLVVLVQPQVELVEMVVLEYQQKFQVQQ